MINLPVTEPEVSVRPGGSCGYYYVTLARPRAAPVLRLAARRRQPAASECDRVGSPGRARRAGSTCQPAAEVSQGAHAVERTITVSIILLIGKKTSASRG